MEHVTNVRKKQEDGTCVAVRRSIVGNVVVPKIRLEESQVAHVIIAGALLIRHRAKP